jgi:hypothetical protein
VKRKGERRITHGHKTVVDPNGQSFDAVSSGWNCTPPIPRVTLGMKIRKSARINDALIEIEELEEREPENRYIVVWRGKEEGNRYSARSLEDAEEYYQYRCRLAEQRRI